MQRIAVQLRVKPGVEEAYDQVHRNVWPELLRELQARGMREYSIVRGHCEFVLYMLEPNFRALLAHFAQSEVDRRWQQALTPLLETVPSLRRARRLP